MENSNNMDTTRMILFGHLPPAFLLRFAWQLPSSSKAVSPLGAKQETDVEQESSSVGGVSFQHLGEPPEK